MLCLVYISTDKVKKNIDNKGEVDTFSVLNQGRYKRINVSMYKDIYVFLNNSCFKIILQTFKKLV